MGEMADLMLEGILDANGEYTGINPGHPVYPKGWFGEQKDFHSSWPSVQKVNSFFSCRGVEKGEPRKKLLKEYGAKFFTDRPTNHAVKNWKEFKAYIDERIGYVKPGKQKKDDN